MKLTVTTILKNIKGDDLIEPNDKNEAVSVTLRDVLINGLMHPVQEDSGVQKVEKYAIALDIQKNDEVEVTLEQVIILKKAVEKIYGPVIVGPVWGILDNGS